MPRRFLIAGALAIAAGVGACGARTELSAGFLEAAGGAGGSPGASSSIGPSSSSTSTGDGGAKPACATWTFASTQPTRVSELVGDMSLTSAATDGANVLIGTTNSNDPSPDPTWHVRVAADDLATLGLTQVALTRPASGISYGALSLAVSGSARGGVAWDEVDGCRFVRLDANGVALGKTGLGPNWCYWLTPRDGGFIAFASGKTSFDFAPVSMQLLDELGNVVATHDKIVDAQDALTYPADRTRLGDGSLLLSWFDGSTTAIAQRFDESGTGLGDPRLIASGSAIELALAPVDAGALLAWTPDAATGGVLVQTLDAALNVGPEHALATSGASIRGLDVVAVPGGALVGFIAPTETTSLLTVQPVTTAGEPVGPPLTDIIPAFGGSLRLTATPLGAMAVFDAEEPGQPVQVYALALACTP